MKRDYLSYTALKQFAKSPNHYLESVSGERTQSDAMLVGSALHCAVLEPDHYATRYTTAPNVNRRTKAGREQWEQHEADAIARGMSILTSEQAHQIERMSEAIKAHKLASELLAGLETEVQLGGELYGVQFRGIADAMNVDRVIDIKTTRDASPDGFKREASNLDYHLQAAIYRRLADVDDFSWVVVENCEPFNVAVYRPSFESIHAAEMYLQDLCGKFKAWDGTPEGYAAHSIELGLPPWHPAMNLIRLQPSALIDNSDHSFNQFIQSL